MCTDIGSKCRPREGIGIEWSQSEALSEKTDSNLPLSASEVHCLDVTTQPNEPDQLLKEVKFPRFSEKTPD